MEQISIGFIGLGRMGRCIVQNLIRNGYQVFGYDILPVSKDQVQGINIVDSVEQVGKHAEIVLLSLPDTESVRDVVLGEQGLMQAMRSGSVIIDTSTIDPMVGKELFSITAGRSITYLDAPVSGSIPWAEKGILTIMVGGTQEQFTKYLPVLKCIGKNIYYTGPSGSGQMTKLCHQLIFYATSVALSEAMALGTQLGLDSRNMLKVIKKSAAPTNILKFMGPNLLHRSYDNVLGDINLGIKDLSLVVDMEQEIQFPGFLGMNLKGLFEKAVEEGYGQLDQTAIMKLFTKEVNANGNLT